jgi:purine-nucleoside phosphorylase
MGLSAVDMETFYLHKEAANSGFRVSSFHVFSDNPIAHKSFLDDIPEEDIKRKRKVYEKLPALLKSVANVVETKS